MIRAADPPAIAEAAALLAAGELVAFPTETVYGLGADAANARAVAQVFAVKERPQFNPLINHAADAERLRREAQFDARADLLAARFWPGPLTLVLPKRANATGASITHAGLPFISVRVPAHPVARALIEAFANIGSGLDAAPSANRSTQLSPTTAQHVADSLGDRAPLILDGGRTGVGVESTIVDLTAETPRILRPGGIAREQIEALIGPCGAAAPGEAPMAPGMLARHYAPRKPLRLNVLHPGADEAFLMFGPGDGGGRTGLNLSAAGDLIEAAANLFDYLHRLEAADVAGIAVMPIPETGLGAAINDRLRRGAAPAD
jgi:L-threonylcarbamoyladenylate synthase